MAKRQNGKKEIVGSLRIGTAGARAILDILKRHGNLRFDSSDDKSFAIEEIAALEVSGEDQGEDYSKPTAPAAHPGVHSRLQGDTGNTGDPDTPQTPGDELPPGDPPPPGYDHDGD